MNILITGGTGSLGTALCQKWILDGHKLTVISRNDHKQAEARLFWPGITYHSLDLGNADCYRRLLDICRGQDFCIHAAAQKQVGEGQYQPFAYLYTNVLGTMYLLQAWRHTHNDCRQVLFISSDKATSAINFYGKTKALAEGLVRAEGYDGSVVRYGNVVTSNGAFIHFWKKQIAAGEPLIVKVGYPNGESPTRFYLAMGEAIGIVEESISLIKKGQSGIFVPGNLPAFEVVEVAKTLNHPINKQPLAGYEKLHEILLSPGEGWQRVGQTLGRVMAPHWPVIDSYYDNFRSDTAQRLSGNEVLERVGWDG